MQITAFIRYKNGTFYEARKTKGFTQAQLAKMTGLQVMYIQAFENFRAIPKDLTTIEKLEDVLGKTYDELFPPEYQRAVELKLGHPIKKSYEVTMFMLESEAKNNYLLPSAEEEYIKKEMKMAIDESLKLLTEREEKIIQMRFGLDGAEEKTLKEIGQQFKVLPERIRQIEAKALRKLKYPGYGQNEKLKSFTDGYIRMK